MADGLTDEFAPGGPGRPGLICVGSLGGLAVHLLHPHNGVLCNGLTTDEVDISRQPAFELLGCRRCARAAAKRGYSHVVDFEGKAVPLPLPPG